MLHVSQVVMELFFFLQPVFLWVDYFGIHRYGWICVKAFQVQERNFVFIVISFSTGKGDAINNRIGGKMKSSAMQVKNTWLATRDYFIQLVPSHILLQNVFPWEVTWAPENCWLEKPASYLNGPFSGDIRGLVNFSRGVTGMVTTPFHLHVLTSLLQVLQPWYNMATAYWIWNLSRIMFWK